MLSRRHHQKRILGTVAKFGVKALLTIPGSLHRPGPVHYVTKHLQQGIESDHFRVKKYMPKVGGFLSSNTAWRTVAGFEAML